MARTQKGYRRLMELACSLVLAGLVLAPATAAAEDDEGGIEGSFEVLYRNVSQSGSTQKYNEDFDGLSSGGRLGAINLNWVSGESNLLDYARFEAYGLGGDPYERADFRMGQKGAYELKITRWKQDAIYNLFELTPDLDGHTWNTQRQNTRVDLRIFPSEHVKLYFGFEQADRTGDSLFMKDVERQLFRMETPIDQVLKRYSVGADFQIGKVDVVFRQLLRRQNKQTDSFTDNDLGLEAGSETVLYLYDWRQKERGDADYTTLKLHAPLGSRIDLTIGIHGTLFGEEKIKSDIGLEQLGLDFTAAEFGGTCAQNPGVVCATDATCDALNPGDVCIPNDGIGRADLEVDTTMFDVDLDVLLIKSLSLVVQYRDLDRNLNGELRRDLNGDGVEDDIDENGVSGTSVRNDYAIRTLTTLLDYRAGRKVRLRAGWRSIDRELTRAGYGLPRDLDFESNDDETLIFGLVLKPIDWFRLNADYEDGDVSRAFVAPSPYETKHLRVRAAFLPSPDMKIDLGYADHENRNTSADFRVPGDSYDGRSDTRSYSASFWNRPSERVDYTLRYARQEVDSDVRIVFDTAAFGGIEDGNSIFASDNEQWAFNLNYAWGSRWRLGARYWLVESDGANTVLGDTSGVVNDQPIAQELEDWQLGLTYSFPRGLYVGADFRQFDYDDANSLLDYDGSIFTVRGGLRF